MQRFIQIVALLALLFTSAVSPATSMPCCDNKAMTMPAHADTADMHCGMEEPPADCVTATCTMHTDAATLTNDRTATQPQDAVALSADLTSAASLAVPSQQTTVLRPPDVPRRSLVTLRV